MSSPPDVVWKNKGNALFQQKDCHGASQCYTNAIAECSSQAVYFSNRSNCHFELGDYQSCLQDAQTCLDLLKHDNTGTLRFKNLWRMARSKFYLDPNTVPREELMELVECKDKTYAKVARRLLQQIQRSTRTGESESAPSLIFLRSCPSDPAREYYTYGHDDATSGLAKGFGSKDAVNLPRQVSVQDVLNEGNSSGDDEPILLSLLFGGVGDMRHPMVTLMDLHQQTKNLSMDKQKRFRCHLTMNDVKAAVLARDVLLLLALQRLGEFKAFECIASNKEARKWALLLHYIYLGHVMPPESHAALCEILNEVLAFSSCDEFSSVYPHIRFGTVTDWEKVCVVWNYWRHEGTEHYDFPSFRVALEDSFHPALDNNNILMDWKMENPEMAAKIGAKMASNLSNRRASMLEFLQDESNHTPELVEYLNAVESPEERAALLERLVYEVPEDVMTNANPFSASPGIALEKVFLGATHALLPPKECLNDSPTDRLIARVYQNWDKDRDVPFDVLQSSKDSIIDTWRVNPTFYCPFWWSSSRRDNVHEFNPVDDFCKDFYMNTQDYMTEKPAPEPDPSLHHLDDDRNLFSFTSLFFWNVAFSMSQLVSNDYLQLEIRVTPINDLARSIREETESLSRTEKGWPVKYHRILTSNIPDYTGMLSIFIDVMPLLHDPTSMIDTHMESNILFNTGIWDDYENFLYSSTAIPDLVGIEAILGFRFMSENCAWAQHYWTLSNSDTRVSREALSTWLHRLYVQMVLPAMRDSQKLVREECANTTALFVSVCDFLINVRRIPAHWVVSAIDTILQSGKKLKSLVRPPSKFPNRYEPLEKAEIINLSSFSLELEMQVALWLQRHGPGPLSTVKLVPFHQDIRRYELAGCFIENSYYGPGGNPGARCLGLLLEEKRSSPSQSTELEMMMSRFMSGMMGGLSGSDPVRDDVLSFGAPGYIVLSCVEFANDWKDDTKQKVTFLMSRKAFEKYQYYYVSLLRTDSWERVHSGRGRPFRLSDAKIV